MAMAMIIDMTIVIAINNYSHNNSDDTNNVIDIDHESPPKH